MMNWTFHWSGGNCCGWGGYASGQLLREWSMTANLATNCNWVEAEISLHPGFKLARLHSKSGNFEGRKCKLISRGTFWMTGIGGATEGGILMAKQSTPWWATTRRVATECMLMYRVASNRFLNQDQRPGDLLKCSQTESNIQTITHALTARL